MECNDIMAADYSISTTTVKHHKDFRPKPRTCEPFLVQQGRNKGRMSCRRRVLEEEHEDEEDKDEEDEEKKKKNSRILECRAPIGHRWWAACPRIGPRRVSPPWWKFTFYRRHYKTDWHLLDHVITVQCSIQRASSHEVLPTTTSLPPPPPPPPYHHHHRRLPLHYHEYITATSTVVITVTAVTFYSTRSTSFST